MAGGGSPTPTKGGKKSVDFIVNLVPTIDLLSVLISFLLITAVWTQLARIESDSPIPKASPPKQDQPEEDKKILILLAPETIKVALTKEVSRTIRVDPGPDLEHLKQLRMRLDELKETGGKKEKKVVIGSEDNVPYELLILTMDTCLDAGLTGMSVGEAASVKGMM
jgi:biopolymer transport protein ExbD